MCLDRLSGNNYCRETESLCVIIANSRVKIPAHGRSVIWRDRFDTGTVHKPFSEKPPIKVLKVERR